LRRRSPITVTVHKGKTLKRGTLRAILRAADITVEEFVAELAG
jgi:predicted RNA binding protein YcfA (HicA-like mRNA interferase family)